MKFRDIIQSILEAEYIYHVSDSGVDIKDPKPYYSDSIIQMQGRGTGHFGSGMYFSTYNCEDYGEKKDFSQKFGDNYNPGEKDLTKINEKLYRVNTEIYSNLYRVKTEKQGHYLHETLKHINSDISYYGEPYLDKRNSYPLMVHNLELLGLKMPPYKEYVAMVNDASMDAANGRKGMTNIDRRSMSTRIIEYNGYNGVNVSGVKELDNTTYGSVIYDLKNTARFFSLVPNNQVNQYCSMRGGVISTGDDDDNIMNMLSYQDSDINPNTINKIPVDKLPFFFNRFHYFLSEVAIEMLSDRATNIYFATLKRKLKGGVMKLNDTKRDITPIINYDIDIILNSSHTVKSRTLLEIVLSSYYRFDDEKHVIPILKRINETGKILSDDEQYFYDELKNDVKDYYLYDGVFD